VTFTPAASGVVPGTLTFTDDAPQSPQTLAMSGTGVLAYNIGVQGTSSQTVSRTATTATFVITAGSDFGFTGSINLKCSGTGLVQCTFNPTSIIAGQTSTLTLSNLASYSGDTLNFGVTGTSGDQATTLPLQLLIPDFGLAVNPNSQTVNAGESATYTLTFVPINNFTDTVSFQCLGVPTSVTCAVNPPSVTSDGADTLTPTLTLGTTARTLGAPPARPVIPAPPLWVRFWLLGMAMAITTAVALRRRFSRNGLSLGLRLAAAALVAVCWFACTINSNANTGTLAGRYAIEIQANNSNKTVTHAIIVQLVVN